MHEHPDTMTTSTPPVAPRPTTRDQQGLLDALAAIDREGWDGETATALLTHIRCRVIRQLTVDLGLRGGAASDAEATAWGAVWIQLRDPHLRSVKSPWGVVWQAARRALIGEILASRWVSDWRRACVGAGRRGARRETRPPDLTRAAVQRRLRARLVRPDTLAHGAHGGIGRARPRRGRSRGLGLERRAGRRDRRRGGPDGGAPQPGHDRRRVAPSCRPTRAATVAGAATDVRVARLDRPPWAPGAADHGRTGRCPLLRSARGARVHSRSNGTDPHPSARCPSPAASSTGASEPSLSTARSLRGYVRRPRCRTPDAMTTFAAATRPSDRK